MASYLSVSLSCRRALYKIHSLKNRVLAVSLFDSDNRFLYLPFVFESLFFILRPFFTFYRIVKEGKLLGCYALCFDIAFLCKPAGSHRDTAHKQIFVYNPIKQL